MKYFFCLIPDKDARDGVNIGRTYAYKNRAKWKEVSGISEYLTAGYVKGVDFIVVDDVAYEMKKTYLDANEKFIVILATESISGCDIPDFPD